MATNSQTPKNTLIDQVSGVVVPFPDRRLAQDDTEEDFADYFDTPPDLKLASKGNAENVKRKLTRNQLLAIGSALVAVVTGAVIIGKGSSEQKPYTDKVTHVVTAGDTLTGIAADELAKEEAAHPHGDPRGTLPATPEEAASYLHTVYNPDSPYAQNPHDDVLQIGEKVVGSIPFTPPAK